MSKKKKEHEDIPNESEDEYDSAEETPKEETSRLRGVTFDNKDKETMGKTPKAKQQEDMDLKPQVSKSLTSPLRAFAIKRLPSFDSISNDETLSSTSSTETEEAEELKPPVKKEVRFKDLEDVKIAPKAPATERVSTPFPIPVVDDRYESQQKSDQSKDSPRLSSASIHVIEMGENNEGSLLSEELSDEEDEEEFAPATPIMKTVRFAIDLQTRESVSEHLSKEDKNNIASKSIAALFFESETHLIAHKTEDFTHGYQENKRYIIPRLTPHEIQRLKGNKFLQEASTVKEYAKHKDYLIPSLAFFTASSTIYLKEVFHDVASDLKGISKVYSARMLSRFHEYGSLFKSSTGREGIVASMRFTSHCSDIIKTYIQLLQYIEDPDKFAEIIMDLAKHHHKLNLKLKDHQKHYMPFIDIVGGRSEEPMKLYSRLVFFVVLVSRAMLKAESDIHILFKNDQDINPKARATNTNKQQHQDSRKQPVWD